MKMEKKLKNHETKLKKIAQKTTIENVDEHSEPVSKDFLINFPIFLLLVVVGRPSHRRLFQNLKIERRNEDVDEMDP